MSVQPWSTLEVLDKMDEQIRRSALRPHIESGFYSSNPQDKIWLDLRASLDKELEELSQMELNAELGQTVDFSSLCKFRELLLKSPAFAQYLRLYLFFTPRFALWRLHTESVHCVDEKMPDGRSAAGASNNLSTTQAPASETPPSMSSNMQTGFSKAIAVVSVLSEKVAQSLNQLNVPEGEFNERCVALPPPPTLEDLVARFQYINNSENIGLKFLDGFTEFGTPRMFELWLRGLSPDPKDLEAVRTGILDWALERTNFYVSLEKAAKPTEDKFAGPSNDLPTNWCEMGEGNEKKAGTIDKWEEGNWQASNPVIARFAVADLYFLAKVLRAEVSGEGQVHYVGLSWLRLIASQKKIPQGWTKDGILQAEEILRAVFDFACDLIQNSVEIADATVRRKATDSPAVDPTEGWRFTQDRELDDINRQWKIRHYQQILAAKDEKLAAKDEKLPEGDYWSRRVATGDATPRNLIGLAFSGGGIRSATIGLGVLERLRELDFLRHADYQSSVSGGGYIGSWLISNVRRTRYWLGQLSNWDESIQHLRNYSKYLTPQAGILSSDTWSMWGTWIRNTLLIQFTGLTALWIIMIFVRVMKRGFDLTASSQAWNDAAHVCLALCTVVIAAFVSCQLFKSVPQKRNSAFLKWLPVFAAVGASFSLAALVNDISHGQGVHWWPLLAVSVFLAVFICSLNRFIPAKYVSMVVWVASFLSASSLWPLAVDFSCNEKHREFSWILKNSYTFPPNYLSGIMLVSYFALALVSLLRDGNLAWTARLIRGSGAILIALGAAGSAYFCSSAVFWVLEQLALMGSPEAGWLAYALGPVLMLIAFAMAVVIFIGLIGASTEDWRREWWTRYGSWLGITGLILVTISGASLFAPWGVLTLSTYKFPPIAWGALLTAAGTIIGALKAGNSSRTNGNEGGITAIALQWLARIGAFLFIVLSVVGQSTLLHLILVRILIDNPQEYQKNYWLHMEQMETHHLPVILAVLVLVCAIFSWRFNVNTFGLNQFYRNRLVRCYLGAARWITGLRKPNAFTELDDKDDMDLTDLSYDCEKWGRYEPFRGPFPILNCALNLGGSSDLDVKTRQSASFTFTPLSHGSPRVGYVDTTPRDVTLGEAVSISGAAASPNMGYNTSPLVAFLLTMFNFRLGWWFPNPALRKSIWRHMPLISIQYLFYELFGLADKTAPYVNLSDGGHFENLAIYELIRRRVKVIIACDGEADPRLTFGSLGNVIRICETDFGARIDIDISSIKKDPETGLSRSHCAVGRITYSNGSQGYLIYLKSSVTGDEDVGVQQYRAGHPDFPHETTADQFFAEDQFEAYRRLGHHIADITFRGVQWEAPSVPMAAKLFDLWAPVSSANKSFTQHGTKFSELWDRIQCDVNLRTLVAELVADDFSPNPVVIKMPVLAACLELSHFMENVFLDMRLDEYWDHPDNRGWAVMFTMWAKSGMFRKAWEANRKTLGIRFEYFCAERLGLPSDKPVVRV